MPQPLSKVSREATWAIGNTNTTPEEHRPHLAAWGMAVTSKWSVLEAALGELLMFMLGANPAPAKAMFSSLVSNAAQRDALRAVADITLTLKERETFDVLMSLFRTSAKERNKIAHWLWGYSDGLPDAVLLCDPKHIGELSLAVHIGAIEKFNDFGPDKILVYVERDFKKLCDEISKTTELILVFRGTLIKSYPTLGVELFRQLCKQPHFRTALSQLRARRKNSPKARK